MISVNSTGGDLVRFAEALRGHNLLKKESLEALWAMGSLPYEGPESTYSGGFIVARYNGTRVVGHGGGWFGITNKFDAYPDLGYTVVILNNFDSDPNTLAYRIREWLTQGRGERPLPHSLCRRAPLRRLRREGNRLEPQRFAPPPEVCDQRLPVALE